MTNARHPRTAYSRTQSGSEPSPSACRRAVREVFRGLCAYANSPLSKELLDLYERGDFKSLVTMDSSRVLNQQYTDIHSFAMDWQVLHFFKKCEDLPTGIDKVAVATEKWYAAEQRCKETNEVFRKRWSGTTTWKHDVEEVWYLARRKVRQILKSFVSSEVSERSRFGPGSDVGISDSSRVAKFYKYKKLGHISPTCLRWMHDHFGPDDESGPDCRLHLADRSSLIEYEQVRFVPKNATTYRAISKPPRWNLFCQLGVGGMIEDRLRNVRIDLRDQSRNQYLAQVASHRKLATMDLSSASDMMATNTIIDFLAECDPLWLDTFLSLRSAYALIDNKRVRLEKISAMGNGFTFPLQTLLFYCVAFGACKHLGLTFADTVRDVTVYGDDIIVPSVAFDLVEETLTSIGFKVNTSKSFKEGDFYESCGTDWYCGQAVRPFFLRKTPCSVKELYTLANGLSHLALQLGDPELGFALRKIWHLRQSVIAAIPKDLRIYGPRILGDSVIHATLDHALEAGSVVPSFGWLRKRKHIPSGICNSWVGLYHCEALIDVPVTDTFTSESSYEAMWMSKMGAPVSTGNRVSRRGSDWTVTKRKVIEFVPYDGEITLI